MNVIVSNRQKEIIDNANIDAIKDLNGLFNVDDLINKFKNYFFSKMILDATSVVNFASKEVLTTLANEIGADKLIILLPATPEPPLAFKKLLIELKIYNFTNDINEVIKFIEKPNTYDDIVKTLDESYNNMYVDNSIKEEEETDTKEDEVDVKEEENNNFTDTAVVNNENDNSSMSNTNMPNNFNSSSLGDILNNIHIQNSNNMINNNVVENNGVNENALVNNIPVETEIKTALNSFYEDKPMDVADNNDSFNNVNNNETHTFLINDDFNTVETHEKPKKMVIGIKNVTTHAGSTSLIYMLQKMAAVNLKKNVLSLEIGKNDFRLFRDPKMKSINDNELSDIVLNSDEEIIFVDLNDSNNDNVCNEILYLVEPSTIKLNELMAKDKNTFKGLNGKKVLLNKSMLKENDVNTLENEAGIKFIDSIEPLNDRIFNDKINKLLNILDIK